MNAAGIVTKLNAALLKVNATEFLIYKRVVTIAGGDALIGRPGSVTNVDTLLSPPPIYSRFGRESQGYKTPGIADDISAGGKSGEQNDYEMLVSPTAMSATDLNNPNVLVVFETTSGYAEVFRITDYVSQAYQGSVVTFTVYLKSTSRTEV